MKVKSKTRLRKGRGKEAPVGDQLDKIHSSGLFPSLKSAQDGNALYKCEKVILFNPEATIRGREVFFLFSKYDVKGLPDEVNHTTENSYNFRLRLHEVTIRGKKHQVRINSEHLASVTCKSFRYFI